jgi:ribosomal protein S18 acetylase RimI-like enzyme
MPNQKKTPDQADMSRIDLRPLRIEDYDRLIRLWDKAGLPYKPRGRDQKNNIASELTKDTAIFLVAEFKGELIGSVFGTHDGRKGWINRLAVSPEYRHRGLGVRLVEEVEEKMTERGIEIIACLVEDWNHTSLKFFVQLGYMLHKDIFYLSKRKNQDV